MSLLTLPLFICLWFINISVIDATVDCTVYSKQLDVVNQNPFYVRLSASTTLTSIAYYSDMDVVNRMVIVNDKNPLSNIFCLKDLTYLRLVNTNLSLLPDIQNLKQLTTLQILSDNSSIGQYLPAEIGELKLLTSLDLTNIVHLRDLPPEIGQLTLLQSLTLSQIPNLEYLPDLDMGQLINLRTLTLIDVPRLFNLPTPMDNFQQLETLVLTRTNVPDLQLQNLQKLATLRIGSNLAMKSIQIEDMPKLAVLEITNNAGLITVALENLPVLQSLLLSSNKQLTLITMQNLSALNSFSVSFSEQLKRATLKNLTGLTSFSLKSNPTLESVSIENALRLTTIDLASNPVLQTIVFTNTPFVNSLDLSSCQLTSLPAIVLTLKNLKTLTLKSNQLSVLPATLSTDLPNLQSLDLSSNKFQGNIMQPPLIYVRELIINNNELTTLDGIGEYRSLGKLALDYNKITSIPMDIMKLSSKLYSLSINYNQLKSIPYSMANMRSLQNFNAQYNNITREEVQKLANLFGPTPIIIKLT